VRARDGSVRFFAKSSSKPAFSILAPTVTDSLAEAEGEPPAQGMTSMSVQRQRGGLFRLQLSIDREWLSDPARAFPVYLDPSYAFPTSVMDGFYNYISGTGAPPDTIHYLELGPRYVGGTLHGYHIVVNYDFSGIPRGAVVDNTVNAYLYLRGCVAGITACGVAGHYSGVIMHALTTPWSATTPWSSVHYDGTVLATRYFSGTPAPNSWQTISDYGGALTNKIQSLLDGAPQYGFLFRASDTSGPSFSFDSYRFDSGVYAPYLMVSWHSVAPSYVDQPGIDGDTSDAGKTLSVVPGDSNGTWPLAYSYYWQRCNESGGGCFDIATGTQYVLKLADVGSTIRVRETVSNTLGSASNTSDPTDVIGTAPSNDHPPTISGISSASGFPKVGDVLSATTGTWSGSAVYNGHPGFRFDYQWHRCDEWSWDCETVGGNASNYTLTSQDVGFAIEVEVTATNPLGSDYATSDPTEAVEEPPASISPPTISGISSASGVPKDGDELTATTGTWSGSAVYEGDDGFNFEYQWYWCDSSGASCNPIPDATDSAYDLTSDDVGFAIEVEVTASNDVGSASARSGPTAVVEEPPANISPPTISGISSASGVPKDGDELTATTGTWSGSAVYQYEEGFGFEYRWLRCDTSGKNCADIPGATDSSYDLTADDVGSTIEVEVTASNDVGSASARSDPTPVVEEPTASNSPPTISGTARDGETLSASHGSWDGTPPIAYAYQWLRCDASGTDCSDIPGATDRTYTLGHDDVGSTIRVEVTATNAVDSVSANSDPTEVCSSNDQRNCSGRPDAHRCGGNLGRDSANLLCLPVAALRRRGRARVHRYPGRRRSLLHGHERRSGSLVEDRRHGHERRRAHDGELRGGCRALSSRVGCDLRCLA
jgi:hypothetical protein